jgi:hypothetical protein
MPQQIKDPNNPGTCLLSPAHIALLTAGIFTVKLYKPGISQEYKVLFDHVNALDAQIIAQIQADAAGEIAFVNKSISANHDICSAVAIILEMELSEVDPSSDILRNSLFLNFVTNSRYTKDLTLGDEAIFIKYVVDSANLRIAN